MYRCLCDCSFAAPLGAWVLSSMFRVLCKKPPNCFQNGCSYFHGIMSLVLCLKSHHHSQGRCWSFTLLLVSLCLRFLCVCVCVDFFFTLVVSSAMSVLMSCSCLMGTRSPPHWCQGCVWVGGFIFKLSSVLLLSRFFVSVSSTGGFLQGDGAWMFGGLQVWELSPGLEASVSHLQVCGGTVPPSVPYASVSRVLCRPLTGAQSQDLWLSCSKEVPWLSRRAEDECLVRVRPHQNCTPFSLSF